MRNAKKQDSEALVKQLQSRQGEQPQLPSPPASISPAEQAKQQGNAAFAKQNFSMVRGIHTW